MGNLPAPPGLTLWMTPAAWIYCGREGVRPSAQQALQASELYPAQPGSSAAHLPTATSTYLQPLQHLIHKKLDSIFTQSLMLHQLAQISAHERHHQVAVETRDAANAGLVPRSKLTPLGPAHTLQNSIPAGAITVLLRCTHSSLALGSYHPVMLLSHRALLASYLLSTLILGNYTISMHAHIPTYPKWQAGFRGTLLLRKGLTLQSFLARNSLCRPG